MQDGQGDRGDAEGLQGAASRVQEGGAPIQAEALAERRVIGLHREVGEAVGLQRAQHGTDYGQEGGLSCHGLTWLRPAQRFRTPTIQIQGLDFSAKFRVYGLRIQKQCPFPQKFRLLGDVGSNSFWRCCHDTLSQNGGLRYSIGQFASYKKNLCHV